MSNSIWFFIVLFILVLAGVVWGLIRQSGKEKYPGASLVFEGGGIRRGLNVVEVSQLFQLPPSSVFAFAVLGLLEKDFVEVDENGEDGIQLKVTSEMQTTAQRLDSAGRTAYRTRQAYQSDHVLLHYEDVLLELLEQSQGKTLAEDKLDTWLSFLDHQLEQKMAGYHKETTVKYYLDFIIHRIEKIWLSADQISSNVLWFVCAYSEYRLKAKKVQEVVSGYSPAWLPAQFSFVEFLKQLETK